jgi:hypothetical protein
MKIMKKKRLFKKLKLFLIILKSDTKNPNDHVGRIQSNSSGSK